MPRKRRKEIGGLDDLLLAVMMTEGTVSIHQLHSTMTLSPGSTARSLERLKHFGWASGESRPDARKTAYEITDEGRGYLREVWHTAVTRGRESTEPEEVFRAIVLAALMGSEDDVKACIPKLKDLAAIRRVQARELVADAEDRIGLPSSYYGLLRMIYQAGHWRGESEALDEISYRLERQPPFINQKEVTDD